MAVAKDQRNEARVSYPRPNKSGFLLGADAVEVLDLSVRGFRFRHRTTAAAAEAATRLGSEVCGILCLRHGATAAVAGRVVRISGNEVAVSADDIPIPFDLVLAERLFLETGRTGLVMSDFWTLDS
jgi:hypothetical protein